MISVCMVTARKDPGYQYMMDSLVIARDRLHAQFGPVPVEFIAIDEQIWHGEKVQRDALDSIVKGRIPYRIEAPKPTVWRGPRRLTKRDYWAKNSALNTAICYATQKHLIFFDDCVMVPEGWLVGHMAAARTGVAAAGGYIYYHPGVVIEGGKLIEGKPHTPGDYRIEKYKEGIQPCAPGELFGGNVSYPLEVLLKIGGFDEILDGAKGLDDCLMGVRAGMVTKTMWIPEIETLQITDTHDIIDRGQKYPVSEIRNEPNIEKTPGTGTKLFPYKDANGVVHQMTFNHLAIWRLTAHKLGKHADGVNHTAVYDPKLEPCRTDPRPIGNQFDLKTLRNWVQAGRSFPVPTKPDRDWRDKQPLCDM